ncbi:MAG: hypothetical protein ABIH90_01635, partial [Candidatus Aenigmatarchaeota archaeon]
QGFLSKTEDNPGLFNPSCKRQEDIFAVIEILKIFVPKVNKGEARWNRSYMTGYRIYRAATGGLPLERGLSKRY